MPGPRVFLLLAACAAAPAAAQPAPPVRPAPPAGAAAPDGEDDATIVVTGTRERGAVLGDIAPEVQLTPSDIRALGVSSIADILTELAPQIRSDRGSGGAPVILLNGRRIAGFAEIRSLPPEALLRVDILPEEVALKYGYAADQRVVNFVLRPRFRATTGEFEPGGPTGGGRQSYQAESTYLKIRRDTRISLEAKLNLDTQLLESDRNVSAPVPARPFALGGNVTSALAGGEIDPALSALAGGPVGVAAVPASAATAAPALASFVAGANTPATTDLRPFRSLLPSNRSASLGAVYAFPLTAGIAATLSAGFDGASGRSSLGLPSASLDLPAGNAFSPFAGDVLVNLYDPRPLIQTIDSLSGRAGLTLNATLAKWQLTFTGNYSHGVSDTATDRGIDLSAVQARLTAGDPALNPFSAAAVAGPLLQDRAHTVTDSADATLLANGALVALPGGNLTTALRAGFQYLGLASDSTRAGIARSTDLSRSQGNFQASFDLPLTSVKNNVLAAVGDLSANFNIAADTLSDFGTLFSYGYGLNWKPIKPLALIASVSNTRAAPTVQQLGNPQVLTPNVRIFDYVTGTTVDISQLSGGNPGLVADNRRVIKLGLTLKPLSKGDLTLSANYVDSRITNPVAGFPTATAELEAAFPERFVRDTSGRLVSIDNRPINFARSERRELRWGLSFSQPLKPSAAEIAAAAERRAAFEARRRAAEPAGGGAPAPGGGGPGGGGAGGRGFGGGGFGGRGGLDGRFQVTLFHTWHFADRLRLRDGTPELDLLNGSATGSSGGSPRHEIEARAGIGKGGLGARLSLNWQSGTRVLVDPAGGTTSPGDLTFSGLTTLNLRLFADLGQQRRLVRNAPWLRGARFSIAVGNLTDARIDVRNRAGIVPVGYQPDRIDPLGRTLTVSFRKLFF